MRKTQKEYSAKWYANNRELQKQRVFQRRQELRQFIADSKTKCTVCGYSKCKAALDFHHIDDRKESNPSDMVKRGWSRKRIENELDKCVVLCSNCHREHHAGEA